MRFSPQFLDEICARLPVSAVVGRKVRLQKQGREWRGLSPFTSEKTPSFFVNDAKMRWFDFSAGKNGSIFDFVMETEGLSFPEAVEKLAGEAGLALPAVSREDEAREKRRAGLAEAMEEAARFFAGQLRGRAGEGARAYLANRGVSGGAIEEFRIGYSPREKFALRDHLAAKGFATETMTEAGLLVHGDDIAVPYDRFRHRVMFPIQDGRGRVIAFGGRALDPDAPAKYLNSPETPLFHKGFCLYNLHRARESAHRAGRVIAVEGYLDVIALAQAGFPETVAPLGTALTPEQLQFLWRMAEEPILCFDGDAAGQKAAARAIETALPYLAPGRSLRFALLPGGQDPDDLARSGGSEAVAAVLDQARPLVDTLWARERDAHPLDTPEQRAKLLDRLTRMAEGIGDRNLRKAYDFELKGRAFAHFRQIRPGGTIKAANARSFAGTPQPLPVSEDLARSPLFRSQDGVSVRAAFVLLALINHPELILRLAEEASDLPLPSPDAARLRSALLARAEDEPPSRGEIEDLIAAGGFRPVVEQLTALVGLPRLRPVAPEVDTLDAETAVRQALTLHRRSRTLDMLRAAEADFAANPDECNWERLLDVRAQLSNLDGMDAAADDKVQGQFRPVQGLAPFG